MRLFQHIASPGEKSHAGPSHWYRGAVAPCSAGVGAVPHRRERSDPGRALRHDRKIRLPVRAAIATGGAVRRGPARPAKRSTQHAAQKLTSSAYWLKGAGETTEARIITISCRVKKPDYVILNNQNLPIGLAGPAIGKSPLCSRPAGLVL